MQAEQVLGAGLASVMRLPADRPAQIALYRACLRRVFEAERSGAVDEARAFLLSNLVVTYLPLTTSEQDTLRIEWGEEDNAMMDLPADVSLLDWAQQLFRDNSLRTRRSDIRRLVQLKFGRLSPEIDTLIEGVDSEDAANRLFDRVFAAQDENALFQAAQ